MERGGGAHEPMRCTFKLTRGRYIFTFLHTLPSEGKESFAFLDIFNPLHKFLFSVNPSTAECPC